MSNTDRRTRLNAHGISLIETLVALTLFAMTVATMGRFLVAQIRQSSNNYLQTKALSLAEAQLEATRAQKYAEMTSGTTTQVVGGVTYTIATTVAADTPANGLKSIEVNVSWKDPQGNKNVKVNTIYTEVRRY